MRKKKMQHEIDGLTEALRQYKQALGNAQTRTSQDSVIIKNATLAHEELITRLVNMEAERDEVRINAYAFEDSLNAQQAALDEANTAVALAEDDTTSMRKQLNRANNHIKEQNVILEAYKKHLDYARDQLDKIAILSTAKYFASKTPVVFK
jgi:chromosome segregation ATPase